MTKLLINLAAMYTVMFMPLIFIAANELLGAIADRSQRRRGPDALPLPVPETSSHRSKDVA